MLHSFPTDIEPWPGGDLVSGCRQHCRRGGGVVCIWAQWDGMTHCPLLHSQPRPPDRPSRPHSQLFTIRPAEQEVTEISCRCNRGTASRQRFYKLLASLTAETRQPWLGFRPTPTSVMAFLQSSDTARRLCHTWRNCARRGGGCAETVPCAAFTPSQTQDTL